MGGALIKVGMMEDRVWGVGSAFGAGQTYAVPSGILQMHESEVATGQISLLQVFSCTLGGWHSMSGPR